jgi:hypothetical protein
MTCCDIFLNENVLSVLRQYGHEGLALSLAFVVLFTYGFEPFCNYGLAISLSLYIACRQMY